MQPSIPLWVTLVTTVESLLIPVVGWLVFQRYARRAARALIAPSAIFVALWTVLAYTLGARGFFSALRPGSMPAIAYAFLPLAIGYLGFLTGPPDQDDVHAPTVRGRCFALVSRT